MQPLESEALLHDRPQARASAKARPDSLASGLSRRRIGPPEPPRSVHRATLAVIVPFRARGLDELKDLAAHYDALATAAQGRGWQFVIADSSSPANHGRLLEALKGGRVRVLRPAKATTPGANDKLNNVVAAVRASAADSICLLDDDARPDLATLQAAAENLRRADALRIMVAYEDPDLFDLIDLAGIFVVNAATRRKQYWGNLCLRRAALLDSFFGEHPILFDELYVETKCLRDPTARHYQIQPPLPMRRSNRTWRQYLEQRLRYAYEDLGQPAKAACGLATGPCLAAAGLFGGPLGLAAGTILVVLGCWAFGWVGARTYAASPRDRGAWPLAPVWFLPYAATTWIALVQRLVFGGVRFGGVTIRRAT